MLLLVLIVSLAAGLRFHHIDAEGYWLDELLALQNSAARCHAHTRLAKDVVISHLPRLTALEGAPPWSAIGPAMADDTHPPLYFILLRLWREAFGDSELAVRSLSVLASLVAIVLLFFAAEQLHGSAVALGACLLMALSSTQIRYAQEARNYALVMALGMGACLSMVRLERGRGRWGATAALLACSAGMALSHYFSIGALVALALYAAWRVEGGNRWRALGALLAAGLVFLVLWGPGLWAQRASFAAQDAWLRDQGALHVWRALGRVLILPLRLFVEKPAAVHTVLYAIGLIAVAAYGRSRRRPELLLWVFWLCGTVGLVLALDLARSTRHLSWIRYTLLAGPAVASLLAAWGDSRRRLRLAMLVAFCLLVLPRAYRPTRPDYRAVASALKGRAAAQSTIALPKLESEEWVRGGLLLALAHYGALESQNVILLDDRPSPEVARALERAGSFWAVSASARLPTDAFPGSRVLASFDVPRGATVARLTLPPGPPGSGRGEVVSR